MNDLIDTASVAGDSVTAEPAPRLEPQYKTAPSTPNSPGPCLRLEALRFADNFIMNMAMDSRHVSEGVTADAVVSRAKTYFAFLVDTEA